MFARHRIHRLALRPAQRLAREDLEVIDAFGHLAVGFGPVLAVLQRHDRVEFHAPDAQQLGGPHEHGGPLQRLGESPAQEGVLGARHGLFELFGRSVLKMPDGFAGVTWVGYAEGARALHLLAADQQRKGLPDMLAAHQGEGFPLRLGHLWPGKVEIRRVSEGQKACQQCSGL